MFTVTISLRSAYMETVDQICREMCLVSIDLLLRAIFGIAQMTTIGSGREKLRRQTTKDGCCPDAPTFMDNVMSHE